MIMRRLIPSTAALLAFEAAAQHLNFTRAGTALGMTQSGVSRQINALEAQLGTPLFERIGPRLKLTDAGRAYSEEIAPLLNQIEAASIDIVRGGKEQNALTIAVQDSLANSWLAPRMHDFVKTNPQDSYFHIVPVRDNVQFDGADPDISILRGRGAWREAHSYLLFEEKVIVVASPSLIPADAELDLATDTILPKLHASHRHDNWLRWFGTQGIQHQGNLQGPRFAQTTAMIEAAIAGLGLAVVPTLMVERQIANRDLHIVGGSPVKSGFGYFVTYPEHNARKANVQRFRDWIIQQTKALRTDNENLSR